MSDPELDEPNPLSQIVDFQVEVTLPDDDFVNELKNSPLTDVLIRTKELITYGNQQVKQLEQLKMRIELLLQTRLQEEGAPQFNGMSGWAKLDETDVGQIEDMEELGAFAAENEAWFLFQRRINNTAYREMLEERGGVPIPGISTFRKVSIKTRKG